MLDHAGAPRRAAAVLVVAALAPWIAEPAGARDPLSLSREVGAGTFLIDGRWIDAPATLRYTVDPPSVTVGAFVVRRDPELVTMFGFASTPESIELGSGPLDGRSVFVSGPAGAHAARGLAFRVVAFVLSELGDGGDAATLERKLGHFLLNDPAVLSAAITGGRVVATLPDDWTLSFPAPDGPRIERIAAHVGGRLAEAARAMGAVAAGDPGGYTLRTLSAGEGALVVALAERLGQPGIAGWLRRVLVDAFPLAHIPSAVADRVSRAGLDPASSDTWALARRAGDAPVLADGEGRVATAFESVPLSEVTDRLTDVLGAAVKAAFVDREAPCSIVSSRHQTPGALVDALALDNGLHVDRRDDDVTLSRVESLDPERVRERGRILWTVEGAHARRPFSSVRSRIVYAVDDGLLGRSWQSGSIAWRRPELTAVSATYASGEADIVVGTLDGGGVFAVDVKGKRLWSRLLPDRVPGWRPDRRVWTPLAVTRESAVLGIDGSEIVRVDLGTGGRLSATRLDTVGTTRTRPDESWILVGTGDRLVAVDPRSGEIGAARGGAFPPRSRGVRGHDRWIAATADSLVVLDDRLAVLERRPLPPRTHWGVVGDALVLAGPDAMARVVRPGEADALVRLGGRPHAVWTTDAAAFIPCRDGRVYRLSPSRARVDGWLGAWVPADPAYVQSGVAVVFQGYGGELTALHLD